MVVRPGGGADAGGGRGARGRQRLAGPFLPPLKDHHGHRQALGAQGGGHARPAAGIGHGPADVAGHDDLADELAAAQGSAHLVGAAGAGQAQDQQVGPAVGRHDGARRHLAGRPGDHGVIRCDPVGFDRR
ncbi:hypothetical protein Skr01_63370 [Sphaerisporangium krabiense]|nr:hypothetical protein Skr01_63370 [Sphaerisporangium krabiense]